MQTSLPTVAELEQQMLEAEGPLTVEGRYFAREADARFWRRVATERQAREHERRRQRELVA
jgi:hypothetical protein